MPIYQNAGRRHFVQGAGVVALIIAALSALELGVNGKQSTWLSEIVTFWTIVPPLWFFVEYVWIFDNKADSAAFSQFKDLQGHASKIWAGVRALLTALYLK